MRFVSWIVIFILIGITIKPLSAFSGTLTMAQKYKVYCDLEFSGMVSKGDARKFKRASELSYSAPIIICLDSPGGNLSEALKAIRHMVTVKTVIPPKARCLSACALIFLGGRWVTGNGVPQEYLHRTLWPSGELGFHGPYIATTRNLDTGLVGNVFSVAIESASKMYELNQRFGNYYGREHPFLSDHLLRIILETTPDNMYLFQRVGDLIMSGISSPVTIQQIKFNERTLLQVCKNYIMKEHSNAYGWGYINNDPDKSYFGTYSSVLKFSGGLKELTVGISSYQKDNKNYYVGVVNGLAIATAAGGNMNFRKQFCVVTYPSLNVAMVGAFGLERLLTPAQSDFKFEFDGQDSIRVAKVLAKDMQEAVNLDKSYDSIIANLPNVNVPNVYALPFDAKFDLYLKYAKLAKSEKPQINQYLVEKDLSSLITAIGDDSPNEQSSITSRCVVFDRSGVSIDNELCERVIESKNTKYARIESYIWPSGGKTIITYSDNGEVKINGSESFLETRANYDLCAVNGKTNNTFCYVN